MKTPLRIALIRQRYTPFGGAERFVEDVFNELQRETAIDITLITRKWDHNNKSRSDIIICNPFYLGRLWRDWSFARCVCRIIEEHDFDIIQSHERIPCCDIYRAGDGVHREWLKQWGRTLPFWKKITIHLSPYHNYLLWQEKNLFNQSRLKNIITNSSLIKKEIYHNFPSTLGKCIVIHNAVNTNYFSPDLRSRYRDSVCTQLNIPTDSKIALFVGSGFKRKGVPLLIELMKSLSRENIHLIVVGKDRNYNKYVQQSIRYGVNNRVHFTGPKQNTQPYYGASDLFLFPTLYDPLPNTVLEAMACGLPALISTSCGGVDIIRDGKEGFIQDAQDLSAWKRNTLIALKPEYNRDLSKHARNSALLLTTSSMIEKMKRLYISHIDKLSSNTGH